MENRNRQTYILAVRSFLVRDFRGKNDYMIFSFPNTFIQPFVFSPCFILGGIVPDMHFNLQKK